MRHAESQPRDLAAFVATLAADHPPHWADPVLTGLWHGLKDEWDVAHGLVQDIETAEAAWVHAWLHRIEGDAWNAGYWYRRAGRPAATGDTTQEGKAIVAALLGG